MDDKFISDNLWHHYLTGEFLVPPPMWFKLLRGTVGRLYDALPHDPHCVECGIPMSGIGGRFLRFAGSSPSSFSSKLCSSCEKAALKNEGGAEVELTLLFADIRDSTPLAEKMGITKFKEIINRFYKVSSSVLIEHNAMVNPLMGDQVVASFVPRFAGKNHASTAFHAAKELLNATGHKDVNGPWIPVGAGIHTGVAYFGAVGSPSGVNEIAVLGSAANVCARLASQAAAGEILISEQSILSGEIDVSGLETRSLELKGVSEPVSVRVVVV